MNIIVNFVKMKENRMKKKCEDSCETNFLYYEENLAYYFCKELKNGKNFRQDDISIEKCQKG